MSDTASRPPVEVSIIVPLFNEAQNVRLLYSAIVEAMNTSHRSYEIVLVDDGSTDDTAGIAKELTRSDSAVRVIRFRRNFGQTPAMSAGIDYARGDILVTMDGDLQNDPRDIALLVECIEAGADLAVGWRRDRKDKKFSRVIPARIANWLIGKVTGIPIKDNGCSLKAYRASVVKEVPLYSEMHRFIPAMVSISGARVEEIVVRHHRRRFGKSKYGIGRAWRVLFDLLAVKTVVAFASRPLLWFSMMAFVPMLMAMYGSLNALIDFLDRTSQFSMVGAGIALQFLSLSVFLLICGVLAELIFHTGNTREHYFAEITAFTHDSNWVDRGTGEQGDVLPIWNRAAGARDD